MLYRTLERFPGQVTGAGSSSARRSELRARRKRRAGCTSRPSPCRASCRSTSRADARRDPRTTSASRSARRRPAARSPTFAAAGACAGACATRSRTRDCVFFDGTFWSSDELLALGLGTQARGGHGAPADRRRRREPGRASRRRGRAPHLHPHQQHEPHPARGLRGAAGGRSRRLGDRPTTAWRSTCERTTPRPPLRATSSSTGSAREGEQRYHDHHPLPRR